MMARPASDLFVVGALGAGVQSPMMSLTSNLKKSKTSPDQGPVISLEVPHLGDSNPVQISLQAVYKVGSFSVVRLVARVNQPCCGRPDFIKWIGGDWPSIAPASPQSFILPQPPPFQLKGASFVGPSRFSMNNVPLSPLPPPAEEGDGDWCLQTLRTLSKNQPPSPPRAIAGLQQPANTNATAQDDINGSEILKPSRSPSVPPTVSPPMDDEDDVDDSGSTAMEKDAGGFFKDDSDEGVPEPKGDDDAASLPDDAGEAQTDFKRGKRFRKLSHLLNGVQTKLAVRNFKVSAISVICNLMIGTHS